MIDYTLHVPQRGYMKVWPTSVWCPICRKWSITRRAMPLYIPKPRTEGGDRVVIYVCQACYNTYSKLNCTSLNELMDKTHDLRS